MSEEKLEIGFDELEGLLEEAEQMLEQASSFANIGKFHSFTTCHTWRGGTGVEQVSSKEWREFKPVRGESTKFLSLHVCLDLQEFNPNLQFEYEKFVAVKRGPSWIDGEKFESDWFATWIPSLQEVLGDAYKNVSEALKYLEGKYVQILSVKQQPTKKNPEPEDSHTTPKLVRVYTSREEAYSDYCKLTGNNGEGSNNNGEGAVPSGFDDWEQLVDTVSALREQDGMSNKEIADALGVDIKYVVRAR